MAPASTVLVQSAVAEGGDLFPALLAHLSRRYPEVHVLGGNTARAHERRDTPLGEGGGLSGRASVNSSIKLGAYAGRLDNLNLAGINNPIPNLTTVNLDIPLVGPTPEPLEYIPLPCRLGQPSWYPPGSTGSYSGGARRHPPPPPPPYNNHPRMRPSTGRAQPRRVIHATGQGKVPNFSAHGGNPS